MTLLGLSVSIALQYPNLANASISEPLTDQVFLAQADSDSSGSTCELEEQHQDMQLNAVLEQANQAIAVGQVDRASQLLVSGLRQIRLMPDSAAKINFMEMLVGSLGGNVAYTSPLEQIMQAVPPQAPQAALAVLSDAYETNQTISSGYSASKTRTFIALANYYTQLGQIDRSSSILGYAATTSRAIQDAELQTIALVDIAEAYFNAEQTPTALPTLDRSLQLAQTIDNPNPNRQAAVLEQIASLYARSGQPDRALEVVGLIQVPYYQSAAKLSVVHQYSEVGQFDRALDLLRSLPDEQKAVALATLAGKLTAAQPQQADLLYAEAVSIARSTQHESTLAEVALRYVEVGGLVATADETLQTIADPIVQIPALGSIALHYAKAGEDDRAEARLTEAIAKLETISEVGDQNNIRQQLIDQMAQNGRYDFALQIVQTIQAGEAEPFDRVAALNQLAEQAIAADRNDAALQVTREIPVSFADWRNRLLLQIARGFAQAGEFDRAQALAEESSEQPKILAAVAAQILLIAGQIDPATALFNQAVQLAQSIENPSLQAETLAAIAIEYFRANQVDDAAQLLNQAIGISETIEDSSGQSLLLQTIAEQLTTARQYRAALQVAEAIPTDHERLIQLNTAIEAAIQSESFINDSTAILAVLDRLNNPAVQTRWRVALADRYTQSGDPTQAANLLNQALQSALTIPGDESQTIDVRGGENPLIVDDTQDRGSFLMTIALRFAQIGQVFQAERIVPSLADPTLRQQTMQQISCYR